MVLSSFQVRLVVSILIPLRKFNYDYSEWLYEIEIPVLICVGKYGPQTPIEVNIALKKEIATSVMKLFDYSGHSPFVEEQDKFIEILNEWIINPAHNNVCGK